MNNRTYKKLEKLRRILKEMDKAVLAYSGGTDSTFLLKVAHDVLGKNVIAVTATSSTYPRQELGQAKQLAKNIGANHKIIKSEETKNKKFSKNTPNRCYYCKRELFSKIKKIAAAHNINYIIDGTNVDDAKDYRPGAKALMEQGIRSPLREAGFTKKEIRNLSREMKLDSWNKPAQACLASRFPYRTKITKERLKQVERAESYLSKLDLNQIRVRHHNDIARIEVTEDDFRKILKDAGKIVQQFKKLGFIYITLDIEGYRTGSLNEVLKNEKNPPGLQKRKS